MDCCSWKSCSRSKKAEEVKDFTNIESENEMESMENMNCKLDRSCWCGSQKFKPFSPNYCQCEECGTLRTCNWPEENNFSVKNDDKDFYGKQYWIDHVTSDYGLPDIFERSRTDLPERDSYWLEKILNYRLPPAKTLELGCSHGGLVYLMKQAGYDASGLELSPWICDYASRTFDIPMLCGRLEDVGVQDQSLDIVLMMDVLEHLPDPAATLRVIYEKLTPGGVLVIQTPRYEQEKTYEAMVETNDLFLKQLKSSEHLYLFTMNGITRILHDAGFTHIYTEPQLFGYDMFLFVSKAPLNKVSADEISKQLANSNSRTVLALLDLYKSHEKLLSTLKEVESDRAARLDLINKLSEQLRKEQERFINWKKLFRIFK